jgi:N-methylhydantoinase B
MAAIDWGDLTTVQPTEVLENRFPLHIEWMQLGLNSGGPGRHRGGLGMRRALRLTRGSAAYSLLSDGAIMPPFGIHGGETGAPVDSYVIKADGSEHHFSSPGKVGGYPLSAGDMVILQSAAGGGYGDPLTREPEAVLRDIMNDLVSIEIAEEIYGVRLTAAGEVDDAATETHRAELAGSRPSVRVTALDHDPYTASGPSKRRLIRLNPADIAAHGLTTNQKIELLDTMGPPLRGWVMPDDNVAPGTVPLDPNGLLSLGIEDNAVVQLRLLYTPVVKYRSAPVS